MVHFLWNFYEQKVETKVMIPERRIVCFRSDSVCGIMTGRDL